MRGKDCIYFFLPVSISSVCAEGKEVVGFIEDQINDCATLGITGIRKINY